jgi:glutamate/tyrosine decarboxylase-like PLP-dependent enzyme
MATQQTVLYLNWSAAFHRSMALLADSMLSPELANLIIIRRAVDEGAGFYDRIEELDRDELRTLCRQGLELAASLRQLLEALELTPGHPLFETWDEFADRAETCALSLDPEVAHSIEQARQEAREGRR